MQRALRRLRAALTPALLARQPCRCISSSPVVRGLEEFLGPQPDKDGKVDHTAG